MIESQGMPAPPTRAATPSRPTPLIPGRTLRLVLGVTTILLFVASVQAADFSLTRFTAAVMAALVVGVVWAPDGPMPLIACGAAVVVLLAGDVSLTWWLAPVPTLLHAVHVLAALAAVVPASAIVEPSALAPSARRFGLAQAIALPVVFAAGLFLV